MILLTGGTGFIGSYLLYYLLKENSRVRAIRRASSSLAQLRYIFKHLHRHDPLPDGEPWEAALQRIEWREADILDTDALDDAMKGVDEVCHAAAIVNFHRRNRQKVLEANIEGTANVVNLCLEHGVKKLGYISSVAALARKQNETVDETALIESRDFTNAYSESKYRAEMEVWRGQAEGLPVVIVNPGVVLGWGDFEAGGSASVFKKVRDGFPFFSSGRNGFVDARDVAKALVMLMKEEKALGQRFVLVSKNESYENLFKSIADSFGMKPPSMKVGPALANMAWMGAGVASVFTGKEPFITRDLARTAVRNYAYSSDKIRELTGFQFTPLEKTIEDTCRVYDDWKEFSRAVESK